MSDSPNTSASARKRRQQAQERLQKRTDLNRHYLEEQAVRALESGSLQPQFLYLGFRSRQIMRALETELGADSNSILNQSICLAHNILSDNAEYKTYLYSNIFDSKYGSRIRMIGPKIRITPTPQTIRALIQAGEPHSGTMYAAIGLAFLSKGIEHAKSQDPNTMLDYIRVRR